MKTFAIRIPTSQIRSVSDFSGWLFSQTMVGVPIGKASADGNKMEEVFKLFASNYTRLMSNENWKIRSRLAGRTEAFLTQENYLAWARDQSFEMVFHEVAPGLCRVEFIMMGVGFSDAVTDIGTETFMTAYLKTSISPNKEEEDFKYTFILSTIQIPMEDKEYPVPVVPAYNFSFQMSKDSETLSPLTILDKLKEGLVDVFGEEKATEIYNSEGPGVSQKLSDAFAITGSHYPVADVRITMYKVPTSTNFAQVYTLIDFFCGRRYVFPLASRLVELN